MRLLRSVLLTLLVIAAFATFQVSNVLALSAYTGNYSVQADGEGEQTEDEQSEDMESKDGQHEDEQTEDEQSEDMESKDGQHEDMESKDGQHEDMESKDGQHEDMESKDGQHEDEMPEEMPSTGAGGMSGASFPVSSIPAFFGLLMAGAYTLVRRFR